MYNLDNFDKWFTEVDKDANGTIDMREMCNFIKTLMRQAERPKFFTPGTKLNVYGHHQSKNTNTGKQHAKILDFLHKELQSDASTDKLVIALWNKYDVDGNGTLDREEAKPFINDMLMQLR